MRDSSTSFLARLVHHTIILAVVALPLALITFTFIQVVRGEARGEGLLDLTVMYPGILLFTVPGVLLYSVVQESLCWHQQVSRARAIGLAPLVVMPWLVFPARHLLWWPPFAVGMAVGLVAFGLLVASLQQRAESSQASA
jgi:hypothetical protein